MDEPPDRNQPSSPTPKKSDLGGLYHGMQFALTTLGGLAAGHWLDLHYLPAPLGLLGGLLCGSVVGMYVLARSLNKK